MKRFRPSRKRRLALLLSLTLLAGVVLFLRSRVAWDKACGLARSELPRLLQMDVTVEACEVDPLAQSVTLRGVSARGRSGSATAFELDSLEVGIGGVDPLSGRVELSSVKVRRPRLSLDLSTPANPSTHGSGAGCPMDVFKRLAVEQLDVKGAQVSITLPKGRKVQLSAMDLDWKTRRHTVDLKLSTSAGLVNLGGGAKDFALTQLRVEGALDTSSAELSLSRAEVTLDDANLSLTGKIEKLCHPVLALDAQLFLPLHALQKGLATQTPMQGHLWAHVSVSGPPENPGVSAEVLGKEIRYGTVHPGEFTTRLTYSAPNLVVRSLTLSAAAAPSRGSLGQGTPHEVRAVGTLKLLPGLPLKASVDLSQASFGRILEKSGLPGAWVDFGASGHLNLQGHLLPSPSLYGDLNLKADRFRVTPRPFDGPAPAEGGVIFAFRQGELRTNVHLLGDRVELSRVQLDSGKSHAQLDTTLFFNPREGLLIEGQGELDLSDYSEGLSGIPWQGRGPVSFDLRGPYNGVKIDSTLSFRDFEFDGYSLGVTQGKLLFHDGVLSLPSVSGQKGRSAYFGRAELDFRGQHLVTRGDVQMPEGRAEDLVGVLDKLSPAMFSLFNDGVLKGDAAAVVHLVSPGSAFAGTVDVDLGGLTYFERRLGTGHVRLKLEEGKRMVLEPLTFVGPLGALTAEGTWTLTGPLEFRIRGPALSLEELVGPERARKLGLSAAVALNASVEGTTELPLAHFDVRAPSVTFGGRSLGPSHLTAELKGHDVQISGSPFGETEGHVRLTLKGGVPFTSRFALSLPEIRPLLPEVAAAQGLRGSVVGQVEASGDLLNMSRARLTATLTKLRLSRGDFEGENVGPLHLALEGGRLEVDGLDFQGPNTQLTATGWLGPDLLDVKMRGTLDMRLLESFVPWVERSSGTVDLTASASGSLDEPSVVGAAEVQDARLSIRDQPAEVRGLSGRVEFSGTRVLLQDVQGTLNEGRVSLRGDVALSHYRLARVEVGIQLDDVSWRLSEDLPLSATGELLLAGKPGGLVLSGDVDIQKLRYNRPMVVETFVKDMFRQGRSPLLGRQEAKPPAEWLGYDVGIHLKDARVDNNVARARLTGNLKVTGTNVRPGLLGTIEATEGSSAFFRGNEFSISQGLVELKGRNGLEATFDVHGQSQVRDYLVRLHAFGRTTEPQVILSSEPQLSEGDILSLLTLGVTSRDKTNLGGTSAGAGLAAEVLFQTSGLDRRVQRFLPKNQVLKDLSFHISTSYNEASGLVEPTAEWESKVGSDQLKLHVSQPVSGRGTKAQAEYRFDERLSGDMQWDNQQSDYSFGNLGLELKLRWDVN